MTLLSVEQLTKRYGDVTVLRDVSMSIRAGEIHALVGANGAGKSTLCKIISGLVTKSAGTLRLGAAAYDPKSKQDAESNGVEIIQQELNLIPTLTVAENLFLTSLPRRWGVIQTARLHRDARGVLDRFAMKDLATDAPVRTLGVGRQQMIEIAGALNRKCRLLILDEPTASLSASESAQLFEHLRMLRDQGVGMIYISHRLDEVTSITDRVTVLRDGEFVATEPTSSLSADDMVDLMSDGNEESHARSHLSHVSDQQEMRVNGLTSDVISDITFDVMSGERLGITGLVGSGRTETLRAIFGADRAASGTVWLRGNPVEQRFSSPSDAVANGLAMVTEDRKDTGLLLQQSIRANTTLCSLGKRFSRWGLVRSSDERLAAESMRDSLETRCESIDQLVGKLSGGNQQKVAISKWLVRDADVFLFDEPTRGIDVAARQRIYRLFESLAADGKALVIASSDLDELMDNCDRIAVMSAGKIVEIFQRKEGTASDAWNEDAIMQASFAGYADLLGATG